MRLPRALDALRDERVWVAWDDEGGRKVPKSPHGGNARTNDPSTWGTYAEAESARERGGFTGVGIVLTDGYTGIDLDGALDSDGNVRPWAQGIVDGMKSYTEVSPSGTGLHIIAWADRSVTGPIGRADHRQGIEVYNNGRYFTVTGEQVGDYGIEDRTERLQAMVRDIFSGISAEQAVRERVGQLARAQVKRMANRTMERNAARDGVRYARVPTGAETCGFCLMLASRGFVYHSESTAGGSDNYHNDCDCKIVPGFDDTEVEGYDPDALYDIYSEAYSEVGGRYGLRESWSDLSEADRERRIERHGGSESKAFEAYATEQVSKRIALRVGGSERPQD